MEERLGSLKCCAGECWWVRTYRATETMQKGQGKGLLFSTVQDKGREVAWKKGKKKP